MIKNLLLFTILSQSLIGFGKQPVRESRNAKWIIDLRSSSRTDSILHMYLMTETVPSGANMQNVTAIIYEVNHGRAIINFPGIKHLSYFMLTDQGNHFITYLPVEPDDNAIMIIRNTDKKETYTFSGKGAGRCGYYLDYVHSWYTSLPDEVRDLKKQPDPIPQIKEAFNASLNKADAKLKSVKGLSLQARRLLEIEARACIYRSYLLFLTDPDAKPQSSAGLEILDNWQPYIDSSTILYTEVLVKFLYDQTKAILLTMKSQDTLTIGLAERRAKAGGMLTLDEMYASLKKRYSGLLREKLITYCLAGHVDLQIFFDVEDPASYYRCLQDASTFITTPFLKKEIQERLEVHTPGSNVPDFTLNNNSGVSISLSDFKGKVVLVDFWFTGCGACLAFHQLFDKDIYPDVKSDTNFVVLSINLDRRIDDWKVGLKKYSNFSYINLNSPLRFKEPALTRYKPGGYPFVILIDKHGKLASSTFSVYGKGMKELIQSELRKSY